MTKKRQSSDAATALVEGDSSMAGGSSTGSTGRLPMWTHYRVTFNFLTLVCASVPSDPEIVKKWLDARQPRVRPPGSPSIDEINEEVMASLERGEGEPDVEHSTLVFQRQWLALPTTGELVRCLVLRMGTFRGHYKDCSGVLSRGFISRMDKQASFAARIKNYVYYDPRIKWIPICRPDGSFITEPDGTYDKPVHPMTRQGPISALKTFEYIEPPSQVSFNLRVLNTQVRRKTKLPDGMPGPEEIITLPNVAEDDLRYLFEYGGTHGYGGERGDGEGRYEFILERIESSGDDAPR